MSARRSSTVVLLCLCVINYRAAAVIKFNKKTVDFARVGFYKPPNAAGIDVGLNLV